MNKLQKNNLPVDMQVLLEAGYIDESLELTCIGYSQLESLLFNKNRKELVELAKEDLERDNQCDCLKN